MPRNCIALQCIDINLLRDFRYVLKHSICADTLDMLPSGNEIYIIWSIDGHNNYATMYVVSDRAGDIIKEKMREKLLKFNVVHVTLELEKQGNIATILVITVSTVFVSPPLGIKFQEDVYMYKEIKELKTQTKLNNAGKETMLKTNLADFDAWDPKVRLFSLIQVKPGEEVDYHVHVGESETFFILSGQGIYNDNGENVEVKPGMVTLTPSGQGHSIKNTGDEMLVFIALIIVE